MRISDDVDNYLKFYIQDNTTFEGNIDINAIRRMVEYKGEGAEYISCSFDPEDEDYKEGYVTLYFWKPAADEDTMVFAENRKFYEYLQKACEERIQKEPQVKDELEGYLQQIKKDLNI